MYDLDGHIYAQKGHFFGLSSSRTTSEYPNGVPLPGSFLGPDAEEAHFDRLGTVVQKYGSVSWSGSSTIAKARLVMLLFNRLSSYCVSPFFFFFFLSLPPSDVLPLGC